MINFSGFCDCWLNYYYNKQEKFTVFGTVTTLYNAKSESFESEVILTTSSKLATTLSPCAVKLRLRQNTKNIIVFYPRLKLKIKNNNIFCIALPSEITKVKFYVEQENPDFVEDIVLYKEMIINQDCKSILS